MEDLQSAVIARDALQLVQTIKILLAENKAMYAHIKQAWADVCAQGDCDPPFVAQCIQILLDDTNCEIGIANLLIDGMQSASALSNKTIKDHASAAALFLRLLGSQQHRLAVKVSLAFHLQLPHFSQADVSQITHHLHELMFFPSGVSSAATLALYFGLESRFNMIDALVMLTINGQEGTAADLARQLGRETEIAVVDQCISNRRLKSACRLVDVLGLVEYFPTVHGDYRRECMEKALGKQLWSVASGIAENDVELQRELVKAMIEAGEGRLAQEFCGVFALDTDAFDFSSAGLTPEEEAQRRLQYLDIDIDKVQFIDTLEGLLVARTALHRLLTAAPAAGNTAQAPPNSSSHGAAVPALGLDVEWKPGQSRNSQPSLLQLSTDQEVVVVDLLAMSGCLGALDALLQPLLQASHVIKLGVGIKSDLQKLRGGFPTLEAFNTIQGCIDLGKLWKSQLASRPEFKANYKHRSEISLSNLSNAVLGKPLDKSMQMSNWERRPLLDLQLRYAALDALAAVKVFRQFGALEPSLAEHAGLQPYVFTWTAGAHHHDDNTNNLDDDDESGQVSSSAVFIEGQGVSGGLAGATARPSTTHAVQQYNGIVRHHGPNTVGKAQGLLLGRQRAWHHRVGPGWHARGL